MHILFATMQREHGHGRQPACHFATCRVLVDCQPEAYVWRPLAFGVRLLDRSHGVERTIYGCTLLPHGLAAFNELRQGINAIESGRRNGASTSACSPTAAQ